MVISLLLFMLFLPRFEMAGEPGLQRAVFLLRLRNQFAHQELFECLRRQVPLEHAADGDRNRARLLGDDDDHRIRHLARCRCPRGGACRYRSEGACFPSAASRSPPPATLLPRTMTAPSCSGEFLKNRFRSSWSETFGVDDRAGLEIFVQRRSGAQRPKARRRFSFDMISQAATVASMACCSALRPRRRC